MNPSAFDDSSEYRPVQKTSTYIVAGLLSFFLAAFAALVRFQQGVWSFGFEGLSFPLHPFLTFLILAAICILAILWCFLIFQSGLPHLVRIIWNNERRYLLALSLLLGIFLFSNVNFPKSGLNLPPPSLRFFAISFRNFVVHGFWVTGVLLTAVALFQRIHRSDMERLDRLWHRLFRISGKPFPFFLWVFAVANLFAWFLFRHMPSIADEISMVFQSRIFAGGHLYLHPPPHVEFFALEHIMDEGRWYSVYPPGYSLMLTMGQWIGAPWLINPLAGSIAAVLIYWLGKETYGEKTARLGLLLASLSPFLWFMSASFMAHPTALLFAALFLWSAARCIRTMSPLAGLAAGTSIGMMFLIRPLTAVGIGLPAAIWIMARMTREPKRTLGAAAAALLGFTAFAALLLLYNYALTGHALTFGYQARLGSIHSIGFGPRPWGVVHTPWRGLMNSASNLWGLNEFLFQWPIPSLVFVFIAAAARRRNSWDAFFFAPILSVISLHFFYFYQDLYLGPRYFFELLPALCLLTARGIRITPAFIRSLGFKANFMNARRFVLFLLTVSAVFALFYRTPLWMGYYARFLDPRIARQVQQRNVHNALVFVDPGAQGWSGMFWNSPRLDDDILFARDLGHRNIILRREYPGKTCYRLVWIPADDRLYWYSCMIKEQ